MVDKKLKVTKGESCKNSDNHEYSDAEGYVDDISDSELLDYVEVERPDSKKYEESCVLVYGIPIVDSTRLEKLKKVLGKLFVIPSAEYKDHYPLDDNSNTKGYCFIEYPSKECAYAARNLIDGHIFDKKHTLALYPLTSLREIVEPDADWAIPEKRVYVDAGDLWWWLQNPKCLDQFAIQVGNPTSGVVSTAIYWNQRNADPVIVNDAAIRENWSENQAIFEWSPYGTYLVTFHKRRVQLWAGERFLAVQQFQHEAVNYVDFSPNETYLVTYARRDNDYEHCLRIFDVLTGELKRSFSPTGRGANGIHDWPFFKWSYDEKYFAFSRPKSNNINIYETENFTLYENKPIKMEGLISFEWNSTKNLIAYYVEERVYDNAPAELGIIEFPTLRKLRAQCIFSVSNAQLFWQKSGIYLAVYTERYANVKKTKGNEIKRMGITWHLEIFECDDKEISIQTVQLPDSFINFGWEHKGNRFCVLVGNAKQSTPLVFRLEKDKPVPTLISKLESAPQLKMVSWAPYGSWLVAFGSDTNIGTVVFIDVSGGEATRTRVVEHTLFKEGCWDPTGRYFVIRVVNNNLYDGGYRMYTFQGRELIRKNIKTLLRFKWRPRPPANLVDQKVKEIRHNLKHFSQKFDEEDNKERMLMSKKAMELRRKILDEFTTIHNAARKTYEAERAMRIELRGGIDTDKKDGDLLEETIKIPLNTHVEVLKEADIDEMDESFN